MIDAGPLNTICDVPGIRVGNAEAPELITGTTVVLPEAPAVAAASVTGGAPGTRGTTILGPAAVATHVHAICLSGGSAFGLDAPGGVMDVLRLRGVGFEMGNIRVPIVPGAIIFDLATGAPKDWESPPWWELGRQAAEAAALDFAQGNAGAGLGARAGGLKGGLGSASLVSELGTVGTLAVVNSLGSVLVPGNDAFWAAPFERNGEFGGVPMPPRAIEDLSVALPRPQPGINTTLGVIATNVVLDRADAARVAVMAQDGLARAIRPAHSPLDGDTVFVLSTAARTLDDPISGVTQLGQMAADCLARAIARGVYEAEGLAGYPGYRDRFAGR